MQTTGARQRVRQNNAAMNRKTRKAYPACSEGIAASGFPRTSSYGAQPVEVVFG